MRDASSANRNSPRPAAAGPRASVMAAAGRFVAALVGRTARAASRSAADSASRPGRSLPPSAGGAAPRSRGRRPVRAAGLAALVGAALLAFAAPDQARAQTDLVSNLSQTTSSAIFNVGQTTSTSKWVQALGFTTGDSADGYTLSAVVVDLGDEINGTPLVSIYSANTDGNPDSSVYTLTNPTPLTESASNTFTAPTDATLAKETKYFVVLDNSSNTSGDTYKAATTASTDQTVGSGVGSGWGIDDARYARNVHSTANPWTLETGAEPKIAIRGSAVGTSTTTPAAPTVTSVALTSDPDDDGRDGDDSTYAIGDTVAATVTFGADVTVTGTPQLTLDVGGTDRAASYSASDSTATQLVFAYTVAENDADADGIAIAANRLVLTGGTIGAGTVDAALSHAALAAQSGHKVDGVRPAFVSAASSTDGATITVTFSETISSADRTNFSALFSGVATSPTTSTVSGSTVELSFGTALRHDQSVTVSAHSNAVRDAAGNGNPNSFNNDVTNNVEAPDHAVAGVAITSDPGTDDNYATGDQIEVTATFGEAMTVDTTGGTPRIKLRIGEDRWADYHGGSGTAALVFRYTVAAGDESPAAGIRVEANTLELNGGTIRDGDDNAAILGHDRVSRDARHRVNFAYPSLVRAETSTDGATIVLTYDEDLKTGTYFTTRYALKVAGAAAALATGSHAVASGRTVTLTPAAPVRQGQTVTLSYTDPDGDQQDGTIEDLAGNDAPSFADRSVDNEVLSDDATLSGLMLNDGTNDVALDPAFAAATTSYAANVAILAAEITVTPDNDRRRRHRRVFRHGRQCAHRRRRRLRRIPGGNRRGRERHQGEGDGREREYGVLHGDGDAGGGGRGRR